MSRPSRRAGGLVAAALFLGLAGLLAGCAGGPLGYQNQVIVHLDGNPSDVAGAQVVADAECGRRGGSARFLTVVTDSAGMDETENFRSPDAVFVCDPRR